MANGKYTEKQLRNQLSLISKRNEHVQLRIQAVRERCESAKKSVSQALRSSDAHIAEIKTDRGVIGRDLTVLKKATNQGVTAQAAKIAEEVRQSADNAKTRLAAAEAAFIGVSRTTKSRTKELSAIRKSVAALARKQATHRKAIDRNVVLNELNKTEIFQLHLRELSLENDVNEARKDVIELVQGLQNLVLEALTEKALAMQAVDGMLAVQSIFTKLLALMPGPRGPRGLRGRRGPRGLRGLRGRRGRRGLRGLRGLRGFRGLQGPRGLAGPPGPPGPPAPLPPGTAPFVDIYRHPTVIQAGEGAILEYNSAGLNHVHLEYATSATGPWNDLGQGGSLSVTLGLAATVSNAQNLPVPVFGIVWTPSMTGTVFVQALGQDPMDTTISTDLISFQVQ